MLRVLDLQIRADKKTIIKMFSILKEFISFIVKKRKYYLIPILLILLAFGAIIVTSQGSSVAPFIYAIF